MDDVELCRRQSEAGTSRKVLPCETRFTQQGVTDSEFKTAEAIARVRLARSCTPVEMTVADLKLLKNTGCEEELCLLSACSEIPI